MNDKAMNHRAMQAVEYVQQLPIADDKDAHAGVWGSMHRAEVADALTTAFETTREQAAIAGADVFTFAEGVTPEGRQAVLTSALLAQLAAKKQVPDLTNFDDWYRVYFDVLTNTGWAVEGADFKVYSESSGNFDAHKVILDIAATALAGSTGLALVAATLKALEKMTGTDNAWMKVFKAESHSAHAARFQIGFVDQDENGPLKVKIMSFCLDAKLEVVQVLFFRSESNEVTFRHSSAELAGDLEILATTRDAVRARIEGRANRYIGEIDID
jgi:hypothetical protein